MCRYPVQYYDTLLSMSMFVCMLEGLSITTDYISGIIIILFLRRRQSAWQ